MCLTDVLQNICCLNVVFLKNSFILGTDCSRTSRATHTHTRNTWTHSCSHCSPLAASTIVGSLMCVCVCVWMAEKGEWWKGRADSDALLNTDERKASWILIRLPPLFLPLTVSLHLSEWKYFREMRLSEPMGMSLGHPFKAEVQVFSKECLL